MQDERKVIDLLYAMLCDLGRWPTWDELDDELDSSLQVVDPWALVGRVSRDFLYGIGDREPHNDTIVGLTLAGLAQCVDAALDLELFVASVRLVVRIARETKAPAQPSMTRRAFAATLGPSSPTTEEALDRLGQIWLTAGVPWRGHGSGIPGEEHPQWVVTVDRREMRKFREVADISALLDLVRRPTSTGVRYSAAMPLDPARAIAELRDLRARASAAEVQADTPEHDSWRASVAAVMAAALPAGSTTLQEFRDLRYWIGIYTGAPGEEEESRRYFAAQVARAAALIDSAIYQLGLSLPPEDSHRAPAVDGTIFVVHGHDQARKFELVRLLDRTTSLDAQVLHELPNRGATVIEKFERHASTASYAIVLLTADDRGGPRAALDADLVTRARQNVVFEMGTFFGLLGREHVAVLYEEGVELPSDIAGLVYIPLDAAGAWKLTLLKELEASGIEVDRRKIP